MKKLINQIWKFGIVGVICTVIDFGILTFLRVVAGVDYLISNAVSFTVSVVANYILSMKYVFQRKKNANRVKEFIVFVILSAIGLLLNQLLMWGAVDGMGIYYVAAKVLATAVVMVYNFVSRKLILEEKSQEE